MRGMLVVWCWRWQEGKGVKVFSGKSSIESSCDGVWAEMTTQAAIFEGLKGLLHCPSSF
jgi:hypothetical protein